MFAGITQADLDLADRAEKTAKAFSSTGSGTITTATAPAILVGQEEPVVPAPSLTTSNPRPAPAEKAVSDTKAREADQFASLLNVNGFNTNTLGSISVSSVAANQNLSPPQTPAVARSNVTEIG